MSDRPVVSLSTCWCSHRHTDGYDMLREMADLGFEYVELSHGIRVSLLPGIFKALHEGWIKVSSVHNFCPLPTGVLHAAPNFYQPTGGSKEEFMWKRCTERTLETARQVGAKVVILHSGSIPYLFSDPTAKFEDAAEGMLREQLEADDKITAMREKLLAKLRKQKRKPFERLQESFKYIGPLATERELRLGVENREGLSELPLDEEMPELLRSIGEADGPFGYWHDAGHAQIKEELGIFEHQQLLLENNGRQLGFHLHDVSVEGRDHQPLGTGIIDWSMVREFFRPEHLLVLELSPRLKSEQILQSREFLELMLSGVDLPEPNREPTVTEDDEEPLEEASKSTE